MEILHVQVRPSKDLRNHVSEDYLQHQYITNELKKAELEAADTNTEWYTHDEVWNEIWERRRQNV